MPEHERWDQALRADVVDALLAEGLRHGGLAAPVTVVLQRPGAAERHDEDLTWWGATHHALGARGLAGEFVVQTRSGRRSPD